MLRADAAGRRAVLTAGPVGCPAVTPAGVLSCSSSAAAMSSSAEMLSPLTSGSCPALLPPRWRGLTCASNPAAAALTGRDDTCRQPWCPLCLPAMPKPQQYNNPASLCQGLYQMRDGTSCFSTTVRSVQSVANKDRSPLEP